MCSTKVHPRNEAMETIAANDIGADGYYSSMLISLAGSAVGGAGTDSSTGCACFADGTPMKMEVSQREGSRKISTLCS